MDISPTPVTNRFARKRQRDPADWKRNLPLVKERIFAYICTENDFAKDSNLVASAVFHRLTATDKSGIRTIRLVADGCGGQNKNCIVVGACAKWLLNNPIIKTIEIVFPVTGHSYMPADRTFGIIEKKLKRFFILVRNYKRKTADSYDYETLMKAVNEVKAGKLNAYEAARKHGIPRTTIADRAKNKRGVVKNNRGPPTTLNREFELRLANGLRVMEKYGFGLTSKETLDLYNLNAINTETLTGGQVKEKLLEVLHRRLGSLESNKHVAIACLLDPRFKKLGFGTDSNAKNA
ncbi:unnamed protein product [Colias eurytheme]|nr:unnamed protein product [Colias eurytheme]